MRIPFVTQEFVSGPTVQKGAQSLGTGRTPPDLARFFPPVEAWVLLGFPGRLSRQNSREGQEKNHIERQDPRVDETEGRPAERAGPAPEH